MGPPTRTRSKVAAKKKAEKATAKAPTKVTKKAATKKSTAKKPTTKKAKVAPVEVESEEEEEEEEIQLPPNNRWLEPEHVKQLKLIRRNVNKWRKYLSDAIKNEYCCPGLLQVEDVYFQAAEYLHGINVDIGFYEPKEEAEPEETEAETGSESESEPEPEPEPELEETRPARVALGPAAAYC